MHTNNSAVLSFYDYVSNPAAVETSEHQTNSKVVAPKQHSDFRPILITPVLTRIMERTVSRLFCTQHSSLLHSHCPSLINSTSGQPAPMKLRSDTYRKQYVVV